MTETIVGDGQWGRLPNQRRQFLKAGLLGALGLSLPEWLALQAQSATQPNRPAARADSVLVILEQGGMSHLDTWDPKPEWQAEHRSPFKPIATNVPDIQFTELLQKTARHADKLAVIRSMRHTMSGHPEGTAYTLQGHPPESAISHPDIGSIVSHKIGTGCPALPPYIMVPGNSEQAYNTTSGFLSPGLAAFKTGGRDLASPGWTVPNLARQPDTSSAQLVHRKQLLEHLQSPFLTRSFGGDSLPGMNHYYEQAFDTLESPKVTAAFDLKGEPAMVRERYGRGHRGACYLLGRKLIEAGVRFVTVDVRWPETAETPGGFDLNWDHHDLIYTNGSCGTVRDKAGGEGRYGIATWFMMGSTDQAFSALLEDMDQRGLLKRTLVAFVTEFGRTPRINKFQGRDHWTEAYSIALAGAGIPGGQVIGASDRAGTFVKDRPFSPADYAESIYHFLGIDTQDRIRTRDNRPVDLTAHGRIIEELL